MSPERLSTDRGNSYFNPMALAATVKDAGQAYNRFKITGQFDCKNSGEKPAPTDGSPGCWVQNHDPFDPFPFTFQGRVQGAFPHVEANDYSNAAAAKK